jgi:hypothetical protein
MMRCRYACDSARQRRDAMANIEPSIVKLAAGIALAAAFGRIRE